MELLILGIVAATSAICLTLFGYFNKEAHIKQLEMMHEEIKLLRKENHDLLQTNLTYSEHLGKLGKTVSELNAKIK